MENSNKDEQIEISFLGMKLKCSNPSNKTIIIIVLVLIFFAVLILLLPKLALYKAVTKGISAAKCLSG